MREWRELLSVKSEGFGSIYGPHSQEVVAALSAIREARWFEHVGKPLPEDRRVVRVTSWKEALTIFDESRLDKYDAAVNGHLLAPSERIDPVFHSDPRYETWWQLARDEASRVAGLYGWAPEEFADELQDHLFENLYEFCSMLLAEIIVSSEVDCTYFREQLSYYHAGHFPCGWEGDWPVGRMRVY